MKVLQELTPDVNCVIDVGSRMCREDQLENCSDMKKTCRPSYLHLCGETENPKSKFVEQSDVVELINNRKAQESNAKSVESSFRPSTRCV
jgi:hypothetical protein